MQSTKATSRNSSKAKGRQVRKDAIKLNHSSNARFQRLAAQVRFAAILLILLYACTPLGAQQHRSFDAPSFEKQTWISLGPVFRGGMDVHVSGSSYAVTLGLHGVGKRNAYCDVTTQVEEALPGVANGDLRLDPGESVSFTAPIYSLDRSVPAGHVYSIWADPPTANRPPGLKPSFGGRDSKGHTLLAVSGDVGARGIIEVSSDLDHWIPIGVFTNKTGYTEFIDRESAKLPQRFYRIRTP